MIHATLCIKNQSEAATGNNFWEAAGTFDDICHNKATWREMFKDSPNMYVTTTRNILAPQEKNGEWNDTQWYRLTYMWLIFMVNVDEYTIHGSCGTWKWEGGNLFRRVHFRALCQTSIFGLNFTYINMEIMFSPSTLVSLLMVFLALRLRAPPSKDVSQTMCKQWDKLLPNNYLAEFQKKKHPHLDSLWLAKNINTVPQGTSRRHP